VGYSDGGNVGFEVGTDADAEHAALESDTLQYSPITQVLNDEPHVHCFTVRMEPDVSSHVGCNAQCPFSASQY